ncbi:MAG: hypothetical protein IT536_01555 [Hyphomicrobiales bacterium]|nr:hypothetical protein [Hyphomicrobiales bacterium]
MLDYEAEAAAVRARTEKLRALRLAREAALPPVAKTRGRKSTAAAAKIASKPASKPASKRARTKAQPLSQWLNDQRKDGRRD